MQLLIPPTLQIVPTASARTSARIDDGRFDADIPRWLSAACGLAEQYCRRPFRAATWREELTDWPGADVVFPVAFATDVSISYWTGAAWANLPAGDRVFWHADGGTSVAPATAWPALGDVAGGPRVCVDITAGPAAAEAVPAPVVEFCIAHVSLWADENRAASPQELRTVPWLYGLLDPLRVF